MDYQIGQFSLLGTRLNLGAANCRSQQPMSHGARSTGLLPPDTSTTLLLYQAIQYNTKVRGSTL